jgi:hypothetical protein
MKTAGTPASESQAPRLETGYRVDNSRWPITVHKTPKVMGEPEVNTMIAALDEAVRRREAFAMVLDLDDELELAPTLRRKLGQLLEARNTPLGRYCKGIAVVARTPHARGVHTALRWLVAAACPERSFASAREAEPWALAAATGAANAGG